VCHEATPPKEKSNDINQPGKEEMCFEDASWVTPPGLMLVGALVWAVIRVAKIRGGRGVSCDSILLHIPAAEPEDDDHTEGCQQDCRRLRQRRFRERRIDGVEIEVIAGARQALKFQFAVGVGE
jgi:hypothetical protein